MNALRLIFKIWWLYKTNIAPYWHTVLTKLLFSANGVKYGRHFFSRGIPLINVSFKGRFSVGTNLIISNGPYYSPTGRNRQCEFVIGENATLLIGNNVGISSSAITCHYQITIGDYVMLGGNTAVYDTNFHSLNANERKDTIIDKKETRKSSVVIEEHVFVGAHSTIMKGVTIGHHSIIGACSVVTKDVPPYQIWAGNPARFIREIKQTYETVSV
jgi:acetyltransferase-like isoleucine patch superfamily enzyme